MKIEEINKLSVGDKVVLTKSSYAGSVGDVVTVKATDKGTSMVLLVCNDRIETSYWVDNEDVAPYGERLFSLVDILSNIEELEGKVLSSPDYLRNFTVKSRVLCYADNYERAVLGDRLINTVFGEVVQVVKEEPKFQYTLNEVYLNQLGVKSVYSSFNYLNASTNHLGNEHLEALTPSETSTYKTWFTDKEFDELEDADNIKHLFSKVNKQGEN